jgi:hypothetical protein
MVIINNQPPSSDDSHIICDDHLCATNPLGGDGT